MSNCPLHQRYRHCLKPLHHHCCQLNKIFGSRITDLSSVTRRLSPLLLHNAGLYILSSKLTRPNLEMRNSPWRLAPSYGARVVQRVARPGASSRVQHHTPPYGCLDKPTDLHLTQDYVQEALIYLYTPPNSTRPRLLPQPFSTPDFLLLPQTPPALPAVKSIYLSAFNLNIVETSFIKLHIVLLQSANICMWFWASAATNITFIWVFVPSLEIIKSLLDT